MTRHDLAQVSDNLVTSSLAVLGLALVVLATSAARARTPRAVPLRAVPADDVRPGTVPTRGSGVALMVLAAGLLTLAVLARGLAAGRAPWGNMYEFGLTGSAAVTVAAVAHLRGRPIGGMAVWLVAVVLLLLGVSVTILYTPVDDLVPVLESRWLVVHVAAAITAGALFTVGFVATAAHLVARRRGADGEAYASLAHTVHLVAFPIWTFAVIAGAIWAENAWGRYWGWDPKETWAFITWVLYAAHLHALSTTGWRGRAHVLALVGFLAFVFNFFGVNIWISGLHSYAGV